MKKFIITLLCLSLAIAGTVSVAFATAEDNNPTELTLAEIFEYYYNNGVYTRTNQICLADPSTDVFHGPAVQEKVTYFNGLTLYMSTNSGYESDTAGADADLNHFKLNNDVKTYDYTVKNGGDIYSFFITMDDFIGEGTLNASNWEKTKSGWKITGAENLEKVMFFVASCYTNDGNYLTLDYATVEVDENGDLRFCLFVTGDNGQLSNDNHLLAMTTVKLGVEGCPTAVITPNDNNDTPLQPTN